METSKTANKNEETNKRKKTTIKALLSHYRGLNITVFKNDNAS